MKLLDALGLGLLQGLTEFLPVSSSGHLVIAQTLLPDFSQPGLLFDLLLHLGTMMAVVLYFRRDLILLSTSCFRKDEEALLYRKLLLLLIAASVPTAVIGLTFRDFFENLFHKPHTVAIMLLATGTLLFISEKVRKGTRGEKDLTFTDALIAGTVQGAAIIPGISRSGSTISALLLRGIDGPTAARFSFLMALPAVFGATLLEMRKLSGVAADHVPAYIGGMAMAFVSGLFAIRFLLAVIRQRRLFLFAIYCWIAGSLFLLFSN